MKPISLDEKRKEKGPHCEWCGEPEHKLHGMSFPLMCPRVTSVQYGHDFVTVWFSNEPVLIAMRDLPTYAASLDD